MKKNKMYLVVGAVVLVILLAGGGWFLKNKQKTSTATTPAAKNRVREEINVLPVSDRPVVRLEPTSDGRSVVLTITQLKKEASTAEYELEYQAGTLLQGAFGQLNLSPLPAQTKILLGSCSAGGACTYHKEVKGGKLLTRYQGVNNYTLKSDWRYIENTDKSTQLVSQDAKFQISGQGLSSISTAIIFNAPGYPDGLSGEPVADIYSFSPTSVVKGDLTITLRLTTDLPAKLAYFDGQTWNYSTGSVADKVLTATAPASQFYTAVAQ